MTMASASAERPSRSIVTMFSALSSSREEMMRERSVGSGAAAALGAAFLAVLRVRSGSSFAKARRGGEHSHLNRNGPPHPFRDVSLYHNSPLFHHGRVKAGHGEIC